MREDFLKEFLPLDLNKHMIKIFFYFLVGNSKFKLSQELFNILNIFLVFVNVISGLNMRVLKIQNYLFLIIHLKSILTHCMQKHKTMFDID